MASPVTIITGVSSGWVWNWLFSSADAVAVVVGVSRRLPDDPRWKNRCAIFNCAGAGVFGSAGSYTRHEIDEALRANLIGTIIFSDRAFQEFRNTGGAIINVISTAAHSGRANETVYCASKWGARGYTEALRAEAKGTPVRVIAVYPGGMKTSFWLQARSTQVNPHNFMEAADVAGCILSVLDGRGSSYLSVMIDRLRNSDRKKGGPQSTKIPSSRKLIVFSVEFARNQ